MSPTANPTLTKLERLIAGPVQALLRVLAGFSFYPLVERGRGVEASLPQLLWPLLGLFLGIRIVPMMFRRLPVFSAALRAEWFRQRQLAKWNDSYQWTKRLWTGLGMTAYLQLAGHLWSAEGALALAVFAIGGLGAAVWYGGASTRPARHGEHAAIR